MSKPIVFTIGHSTHAIDYFLELLRTYGINCLIDVRSIPASGYNPQYNQEPLANFLKKYGIAYFHFRDEFGARQTDEGLLNEDQQVDFEKVRQTVAFQQAVERLGMMQDWGAEMALMCSESHPLDCHRFSMVSVALQNKGFEVKHILKDNTLLEQAALEKLLLKKYEKRLPQPDIFNPDITVDKQLKEAYRLHNRDIGFRPYKKDTAERL